ncbi:MAG: MoxR family ATPase [Oscillospiraceae bacterium]|jgi:MoxR-like ATPase|nr:MoxR family ATPase [Oscillospiraceae bacterium]
MSIATVQNVAGRIIGNIGKVIVGKEDVARQALICLIGSGHMLLEDVPGTGKTLFARALAKSLDCSFSRIQFTPDLLPSDITGIQYYNQKNSEFILRKGPVFTNILLADEINRATPRTQSAMLECMEERQVSIDNDTMPLAAPFFVLATQNPVETQGTFPLPEAQLDRFLIKGGMGYPAKEDARLILERFDGKTPLDGLEPVANAGDIARAAAAYPAVFISDDLKDYIIDIAEKTRNHEHIILGVSPRGTQALMKAAKIHAAIEGREFVIPDDIKAMCRPVLSHRIIAGYTADGSDGAARLLDGILDALPVPKE